MIIFFVRVMLISVEFHFQKSAVLESQVRARFEEVNVVLGKRKEQMLSIIEANKRQKGTLLCVCVSLLTFVCVALYIYRRRIARVLFSSVPYIYALFITEEEVSNWMDKVRPLEDAVSDAREKVQIASSLAHVAAARHLLIELTGV